MVEVTRNNSIFFSTIRAHNIPESGSLTYLLKADFFSYYGINTNLFYAGNNNSTVIVDHQINNNPNIIN